jgi:hypothetical protein
MTKNNMDKTIWLELQRQLDAKGLKVKRGTIQDATFIEADSGSSKNREVTRLKIVAAETAPGQRKETKHILVTSLIRKPILITV